MAPRAKPKRRKAHVWDRQTEDWYVDPPWCSARLFEVEDFTGGTVYDPACGLRTILKSAEDRGIETFGSDLVVRSPGVSQLDFLGDEAPGRFGRHTYIVSNPPYRHAQAFAERALTQAIRKVAFLLPTQWLQGDDRSRWLEGTPLRSVYFLTPRPSMPPGHVLMAGGKAGGGTSDYAWFVWLQGFDGRADVRWLRRDG